MQVNCQAVRPELTRSEHRKPNHLAECQGLLAEGAAYTVELSDSKSSRPRHTGT